MKLPVSKVAPLLFVSGLCALVYQSAWLRELRLVFGASTAASAAVLAIFMGGLGAGGVLLGKRADERRSPLELYGNLELGVAALAALTPPLVMLVRFVYTRLGGTVAMGLGAGTVVRLLLSALVLLPPTLLMGGTLPAAAKAVETRDDESRRNLAVLYGVNTLGAVTGAVLSTFLLLEIFGARLMLWMACAINALLAVAARVMARNAEASARAEPADEGPTEASPAEPTVMSTAVRFTLGASAAVGFAFFLMELVWYRMLGPLLGGSSYTFGLILALALLGVGLGGATYAAWMQDRPATMGGLALTSALEALAVALPFALGDRLAYLALQLRPFGTLGFGSLVVGWSVVAAIVVLPAAFVSGVQFPLLIALLGRGDQGVGKQVGLAYAWNTAGAIAGSLAGGFGLMPLLTAPGLWKLVVVLLGGLGVAAGALSLRDDRRPLRLSLLGGATALSLLFLAARGPTAVWRHSGIGVGRTANVLDMGSRNAVGDWESGTRRAVSWEAEGVESSVSLISIDGYAFMVNGKADGHAYVDAGTQVMGGLLGALLADKPSRAFVVGLGTGSTAGWLGAIPGMERVDVVELEPAIVRVARDCAPVNHGVLDNPKVRLLQGDGREVLLTGKGSYDVIFSEPSNPYRAGIASLFTEEFYRAASARLAPHGVFVQWLQSYEIDAQTVRTAYATLAAVFPEVETWESTVGDMLLVASREPLVLDVPALRARIAEEPYQTALEKVWRAGDLEGLLAHYLANSTFAREIARQERGFTNTDDQNLMEFGFARGLGQRHAFGEDDVHRLAGALRLDRPAHRGGPIDWGSVEEQRRAARVQETRMPPIPRGAPAEVAARQKALLRWGAADFAGVLAAWHEQPKAPSTWFEIEVIADALADAGSEEALPLLDRLRTVEPGESDAMLAVLRLKQGRVADAEAAAIASLVRYREDPWAKIRMMRRLVRETVPQLARDKASARRLFDAMSQPFAVHLVEDDRREVLLRLAARADFKGLCAQAFAASEPNVPWQSETLALRRACYTETHDPRAAAAEADLAAFLRAEPRALQDGFTDAVIEKEDQGKPAAPRKGQSAAPE